MPGGMVARAAEERRGVRGRGGLCFLGAALVVLVLACGEEFENGGEGGAGPTGPCNEHPWTCPAGQTCWINDAATAYECLNSGTGQAGEQCWNYQGNPTCTDGLGCWQASASSPGVCVHYCSNSDPAHACPEGRLCPQVEVIPDVFTRMCQP